MTNPRILIVEDNPKNMKLVRDVLEHHGYTTIAALSAEDALAAVADAQALGQSEGDVAAGRAGDPGRFEHCRAWALGTP